MKILEPIEHKAIPVGLHIRSDYLPIYDRALALDGLVLPVEFDSPSQARAFANFSRQPRSRMAKAGLAASTRGSTVFLYRK